MMQSKDRQTTRDLLKVVESCLPPASSSSSSSSLSALAVVSAAAAATAVSAIVSTASGTTYSSSSLKMSPSAAAAASAQLQLQLSSSSPMIVESALPLGNDGAESVITRHLLPTYIPVTSSSLGLALESSSSPEEEEEEDEEEPQVVHIRISPNNQNHRSKPTIIGAPQSSPPPPTTTSSTSPSFSSTTSSTTTTTTSLPASVVRIKGVSVRNDLTTTTGLVDPSLQLPPVNSTVADTAAEVRPKSLSYFRFFSFCSADFFFLNCIFTLPSSTSSPCPRPRHDIR